ncbi:hypothetical protein OS493_037127 [Desmophyllum pertusum]|uniref:Peptidase M12A domain-containing protein n=1 Tax=Desmophyllum pertusum TaxID=174260 RepID=A0A9W9ZV94_9CNID|nr:hypothetical protein OS493_037127 [Desmophyllum pertusum]
MNAVYVLLFVVVCLTRVSLANNFYLRRLPGLRERIRGHGFYDENEYDDGYAEYTGAEKRTFSEMQRRRFQNVEEDEPQEKRTAIDDLLLRELTRGEYHTETNDEEYPYNVKTNERRFDEESREESFDRFPERTTKSDELQGIPTEDGVGTAIDDLALKREEEKMNQDKRNNFDFLPNDGELFEGDMIMDQRLRSWVTGQFDKRDAINDESYMWPATTVDGKRIIRVPYTLSDEIKEGLEHNFEKYARRDVKTLPTNKYFYDFDVSTSEEMWEICSPVGDEPASCLHYNNYAFSKNGKDTIQSLDDPERRFGQRDGFSKHDIRQINELYDCKVDHLEERMNDSINYD